MERMRRVALMACCLVGGALMGGLPGDLAPLAVTSARAQEWPVETAKATTTASVSAAPDAVTPATNPDSRPDAKPAETPTADALPADALAAQGKPCAEGACPAPLTCVEYYGIAGPRGPKFTSCEAPCRDGATCPGGQACTTIADGPGQVCRP